MNSIDTIRRFAKLEGNYSIKPDYLALKTETNGTSTIGLTQKELEKYVLYPIVSVDFNNTTYLSEPDSIQLVANYTHPRTSTDLRTLTVATSSFSNLTNNENLQQFKMSDEERDRRNLTLSDNIIIKCMDPDNPTINLPSKDFWCQAVNNTYIQKFDITFYRPDGKILWYYGKKKGSEGGRPRRRATFRQRRLKRAAAKSRRRATRRTRRRV